MRLSEKTLELTFCSQFAAQLGLRNVIWFGLTQMQERWLGFDACTQVNGRLLVRQFKASNVIVHPRRFRRPRRRFTAPHRQLVCLQRLASTFPRTVYYALPNLGTTTELSRNRDVISQTWVLDVSLLPYPFPAPTNKAQNHYVYIDPPDCELRSESFKLMLMGTIRLGHSLMEQAPNSKDFVDWCYKNEINFKGLRAYGILWKAP